MNNKTMKILIVLSIFVAFSFGINSAFANYYVHYENGNIAYKVVTKTPPREDRENSNETSNKTTTTTTDKYGTTTVNNYYDTEPSSSTKSSTTSPVASITTTKNKTTNSTSAESNSRLETDNNTDIDGVYGGARDVTGSDLTALSLRGSGGFMPSSIWQWILVVFLILIVIILIRIITKPRPEVQEINI